MSFASEKEYEEAVARLGGQLKKSVKGGGGKGKMSERRGEPASPKQIGNDYERKIQRDLEVDGIAARRGKQNIADIGDMGEGDVCFADWMIETKKHKKGGFSKATKQVLENTPTWAHGGAVVEEHGVDWLAIKWKDRLEFAVSYCDARGFDVVPRLKGKK